MLDLIFAALMIIIIVKANNGVVDDLLCSIALVIGILAGILGLVQAFLGSGDIWALHIAVMLIAFLLKRAAKRFAKLHVQKMEELEEEYNKIHERLSRSDVTPGEAPDYDDPNVRFGGGDGKPWNGK